MPLSPQLYNSVISLYNKVIGTRSTVAANASSLGSNKPLCSDESVYLKDWKDTFYTPPTESATDSEEKNKDRLRSLTELRDNIQALQASLHDMSLSIPPPVMSADAKVSESIDLLISRIHARLIHYTDLPASFMRLFTPPSTGSTAAAWYRSALGTVEFKHGLELLASRLAYFSGKGLHDSESTIFRDRYRGLLSRALVWLKDGIIYQLTNYENDFLDRLHRQDDDHLRFKVLVKGCAELNHMIQTYAPWVPFEEIEENLFEMHVIYFRIRNYEYPLRTTDYTSGLKELEARLAFDIQLYMTFIAAEQESEHWPSPPWGMALKSWIKKKMEEFGNAFPEHGSVLVNDLMGIYRRLIGIRNDSTISLEQLNKALQ